MEGWNPSELQHFGVKGMHWGVRKERETAGSGDTFNVGGHQFDKKKVKKAAVIFGAAVGVAAIAVGTVYAAKYMNGGSGQKLLSDIHPSASAKKFADAMAQEPLGIVHASRGKNHGFTFPAHGGLNDPFKEWEKAGFDANGASSDFRRYGDKLEKVAARFKDPLDRVDRAGRAIHHEVMLPEALAKGVNSSEDAAKVAWPLIKDTYEALYNS